MCILIIGRSNVPTLQIPWQRTFPGAKVCPPSRRRRGAGGVRDVFPGPETMGKSWENHGKIMGNHGKIMGKYRKNMEVSWKHGTSPINDHKWRFIVWKISYKYGGFSEMRRSRTPEGNTLVWMHNGGLHGIIWGTIYHWMADTLRQEGVEPRHHLLENPGATFWI